MLNLDNTTFSVGDWLVQSDINQISTATQSLYLRPQLMNILVYLASLQGRLATLESMHDDLWSGKVVSSGSIYNCIAELRQSLAKDGKNANYIETISKKGYRLTAPVVVMATVKEANDSNTASVVILPLYNHSADVSVEYLCDGIAEEIIYLLSRVKGLKVFSAFTLKDERLDPRVVGLRFSSQTVMTGSLKKAGEKLRLSFRLDDVSSGETLWSNRYEQQILDVFEVQEAVARQVVGAMSPTFGIESNYASFLENSGTHSLDAFNAFLLGKHALSSSTAKSFDDAIQYFENAVAIDPAFARAHYRLYLACYVKGRMGVQHAVDLKKARYAAENAKRLGYQPAVPWVHIERRLYRNSPPNTRELALEALDKIRIRDSEWGSFAYEQLTWVLPALGYFQATLDFAKLVIASPMPNFEDSDIDEELPNYFQLIGQFETAIQLWSVEIHKDPVRPQFRFERSLLYSRTGQFEYAQRDINEIGYCKFFFLAQAFFYYWRGEPSQIIDCHERLLGMPDTCHDDLVFTYSLIGDFDSAINQFAMGIESISGTIFEFGFLRARVRGHLPLVVANQLESHPGFQLLLEKEGIDEDLRAQVMERVNDLTDITGIHISAEDHAYRN